MARHTTRRRAWVGIGLVLGVIALAAGAWGLHRWAPFADEAAAAPKVTWPKNVQPVVDFVQDATQQQFLTPVKVEFIADTKQYNERVDSPPQARTQSDVDDAAVGDAVGRALGWWRGDASVLESFDAVTSGDPFPAEWLIDENTIVINAKDAKATLSPFLRAELALALAQVLDDQQFHFAERVAEAETSQRYQVLLAVAVGHSLWVHDRYIDHLNADDSESYYDELDRREGDYADQVSDVPLAYRAMRGAGQQLGPTFIEALTQTDRTMLTAAMSTDLPDALDQVALPTGKYVTRDPLEPVADPAAPAGAHLEYTNQLGPTGLYLMLATGMPAGEALTAGDGWGNDRYAVYTLDSTICVDLHIVADSRADAERLENGLNGWASARPAASKALVARKGTDLFASVCDPGTKALQPVPSDAAINQYFGRANMIEGRTADSGKADLAECVAVKFFARYDVSTLSSFDPSFDLSGEIDDIEQDCLKSV